MLRIKIVFVLLLTAMLRPLAAQEAPLTLREVYELAAERNPTLLAARSATAAAAARQGSAALPPDPQIQLGVMNASLPGLRADMPGSMIPSVQAMQMIPIPGSLRLSAEIARQSTAIADAGAAETAWEVRARAAMAFYEIYQMDRQVAVMEETLEWLRQYEQVANTMYSVGAGRQSDVLRAGVELARMQAEIVRMQAMRTAAAARLNAVLDRPAQTPVGAIAFDPLPLVLPDAATLESWAEASKPMLTAGRIGVEQAGRREALARREIWPDLAVGVQYGQRPGEMGTERMGSLMLGFSVPIFAGRRQLQMRQEAAAMGRMAAAELGAMRAQVNARIGELLAELDRARTLVTLLRSEVLPQAEANLTSAFSAYRVGRVDFMTLVDAQMTLNRYQQELYLLLAEYGQLVAELEMTIGRELPPSTTNFGEAA